MNVCGNKGGSPLFIMIGDGDKAFGRQRFGEEYSENSRL